MKICKNEDSKNPMAPNAKKQLIFFSHLKFPLNKKTHFRDNHSDTVAGYTSTAMGQVQLA